MATEYTSSHGLDRPQSLPPQSYVDEAQQDWYATEDLGPEPKIDPHRLAQALGWFSVGLGLIELAAPRTFGRAVGIGDQPALVRLCGARELISGLGMLSERYPSRWAMARVAGDAMDLTLLGVAARQPEADPRRIAFAATAVACATAIDVLASRELINIDSPHEPHETIVKSLTINCSADAAYEFWRDLKNFPRFMRHVESVETTGARTSHWVARGPGGAHVEWDAEIVQDEANSRMAWRTLPYSEVEHEGVVSFEPAPGGRGTIVRVSMRYVPPAGKFGVRMARLFGEEPSVQLDEDLRRMKQLIETGEIATTAGQPSGQRSVWGRATLGRWMT